MTTGVRSERSSTSDWNVASLTSMTVTPPPAAAGTPGPPCPTPFPAPAGWGGRRGGTEGAEIHGTTREDGRSSRTRIHGY
jgi:hypothetical protein